MWRRLDESDRHLFVQEHVSLEAQWKHTVHNCALPTLPATGLVSKPLFTVRVWREDNRRQRPSIGAIVLWLRSTIPSGLTERLRSKASALQLWDYLCCRVVLPLITEQHHLPGFTAGISRPQYLVWFDVLSGKAPLMPFKQWLDNKTNMKSAKFCRFPKMHSPIRPQIYAACTSSTIQPDQGKLNPFQSHVPPAECVGSRFRSGISEIEPLSGFTQIFTDGKPLYKPLNTNQK